MCVLLLSLYPLSAYKTRCKKLLASITEAKSFYLLCPTRFYFRGDLIAAWAGAKITEFSFSETSFHFQFSLWLFFRKPRVCGEKFVSGSFAFLIAGSPPRMRGKEQGKLCVGLCRGITPAYAGKSAALSRAPAGQRDHPRVCGEKWAAESLFASRTGSPPRMRGKGSRCRTLQHRHRITPTYAGKRAVSLLTGSRIWDHPRVCGEKHEPAQLAVVVLGITPAYAGKSNAGTDAADDA